MKKGTVKKMEATKVQAPVVKAEEKKAEAVKTEVVKAEAVKVEPAKAEATKVEPAKAEPAKVEPAKAEAVKAEPAKTVKKAAPKKTTKAVAKKENTTVVKVQFQNREADLQVVEERVKEQFAAEGHRPSSIKSLNIYVKPEEYSAYYVINEKYTGRVDLF